MHHQRAVIAASLIASLTCAGLVQASAPTAPAPIDWPGPGNGADESGYSPLDQINRKTVGRLGLAWSLDLPGEQTLEATPIQVDGILYFTGSRADVYAVDARSGRLLWRHEAEVWKHSPEKMHFIFPINRGCAYADGRIFSATTDGRLLALDAKTGKLLWSVQTLDPKSPETITGAPRTFAGKVMIGHGGGDIGTRGHVQAYDQKTGREVWKFHIVPGSPAENAGDPAMERAAATWSGEYWKTGTGGAPWNGLTYDPELNQVYIGTGNSGPYDPAKRSPGNGDNLYLASIVALDADTGKYKWHYQVNPREAWDYKATMNMISTTVAIDERPRKVLMQAPSNGFYYMLDRETGRLLSAEKIGKVTWADRIDLKTGRPVEAANIRYESGETVIWPSVIGAHNWMPMAYSPKAKLAFVPYMQLGMHFRKAPASFSGVEQTPVIADDRDGKGSLLAWDPVTQKPRWRVDYDWLWNGGPMVTAGDLVFQGTADGWLIGYDAETGRAAWRFYAGLGILSQPISYAIDGQQYVATLVGYGAPNVYGLKTMMPGWKYGAQPRRLLVFKLGATAKLPPTAPRGFTLAPLDDPKLVLDPAQVARGKAEYARCTGCHGAAAVSSGAPGPDLRESAIALDADALHTVLTEGAFMQSGMPRFEELDRAQIAAIHAYIRDRARAALRGDQPDAPARASTN